MIAKILKVLAVILILGMSVNVISAAEEEGMTLDGMTGGMSTDSKEFLIELMMWVVVIGLIVCAIIAIYGLLSASPTYTKFGVKGLLGIIGVLILYYATNAAIKYVQLKYGA